jgi:hypothetical protein
VVSSDAVVRVLIWFLGLVFGAGVTYASILHKLRQNHKDINAIGGKQRRLDKNLVLVMLAITESKEDRIYIAQFLKDP